MSNIKKITIGALAILTIVTVIPITTPSADAQTATTCRVRADITADEASELAGRSRSGVTRGTSLSLTGTAAGENGIICMYSLVKWVANVIFLAITVIAVLMIAYASFLFVTSADNAQKRNRGKQALLWAIVGLILASIAKLIPPIVMGIIS
ncbi:MAG: hypothetical protein WDZ39_00185 [Candidatus Spechtbacterales bacterium]